MWTVFMSKSVALEWSNLFAV